MKKILKIAFAAAGTIIGAGFATGKEITVFFPVRGAAGITLLIISVVLMFTVSMLFCFKREKDGVVDKVFGTIFTLFIASCACVMMSGGGAALNETFGIPTVLGTVLTYIICILITFFGIDGIYLFNSFATPVMIFLICLVSFKGLAKEVFLSSSPAFLCVSYCGYNLLSFLPFIKSVRENEENPHIFIKGTLLGFCAVLVCAVFIKLAADKFYIMLLGSELPLLKIANIGGRLYGIFYGICAYLAILTTAASSVFCLSDGKNIFAVTLPLLLLSFIGFEKLVTHVYSFFGYAGTAYVIYIILTAFISKKEGIVQHGKRNGKIAEYYSGKS